MENSQTSSQDVNMAPLSITPNMDKRAYYALLRSQWAKAKQAAIEHPESFEAVGLELKRLGLSYSPMSAWFTKLEMSYLGLDGLPYVDAKTFKGWQMSGFKVVKGQHSKIHGLVWMHPKSKNAEGEEVEDDSYCYPKVYHLFHKSQVEAMGTKTTEPKILTVTVPEMGIQAQGESITLNR